MPTSPSNKLWYWVVGITTVTVILVGVLLWQNNQSTVIEETSVSPSPTSMRHDNSGAGATQENPLQEHFDRAMQHLGL